MPEPEAPETPWEGGGGREVIMVVVMMMVVVVMMIRVVMMHSGLKQGVRWGVAQIWLQTQF